MDEVTFFCVLTPKRSQSVYYLHQANQKRNKIISCLVHFKLSIVKTVSFAFCSNNCSSRFSFIDLYHIGKVWRCFLSPKSHVGEQNTEIFQVWLRTKGIVTLPVIPIRGRKTWTLLVSFWILTILMFLLPIWFSMQERKIFDSLNHRQCHRLLWKQMHTLINECIHLFTKGSHFYRSLNNISIPEWESQAHAKISANLRSSISWNGKILNRSFSLAFHLTAWSVILESKIYILPFQTHLFFVKNTC